MTRAQRRKGLRAVLLSHLNGDGQVAAKRALAKIEAARGRRATLGDWHGKTRDTLVVFQEGPDGQEVVAGVVIDQLPAIDIVAPAIHGPEAARIIEFAHTRAEGVLQGFGAQEYLATVALDEDETWRRAVGERFDDEEWPADQFAVYRKAL